MVYKNADVSTTKNGTTKVLKAELIKLSTTMKRYLDGFVITSRLLPFYLLGICILNTFWLRGNPPYDIHLLHCAYVRRRCWPGKCWTSLSQYQILHKQSDITTECQSSFPTTFSPHHSGADVATLPPRSLCCLVLESTVSQYSDGTTNASKFVGVSNWVTTH